MFEDFMIFVYINTKMANCTYFNFFSYRTYLVAATWLILHCHAVFPPKTKFLKVILVVRYINKYQYLLEYTCSE